MPWLLAVMLVYGLFNIVLGIEAFLAKGSVVSLAAAGTAGILVIGCAALAKTNPRIAYIAATVIALLIAGRFVPKMLEGQFYPATLTVVVSVAFALTLVLAHFAATKRRSSEANVEPKPQ